MPRKEWVLQWPGQVVICASSIFWTKEVAEAIENNSLPVCVWFLFFFVNSQIEITKIKSGCHLCMILIPISPISKAYVEQCNLQITDIVQVVRGNLKAGARMTIGALIVIDVHGNVTVFIHGRSVCVCV